MPRFEPFAGLRYDLDRVDLADVTAPPYDVIAPDERAALVARSPYNAVEIDLPVGGDDRYERAARLLEEWQRSGILVRDEEASFYVYRMGFHDEAGRALQTSGVIGALELSEPSAGDVLPHEQTTSKDRSDRLELMRATRANLSAVWGLSAAQGLGALCEQPGPPVARWTDDEGTHHRLYQVTEAGMIDAIRSAVASAPVVIADGHHRYETALAYRDEVGAACPGANYVMAFLVELAPEQLTVQAIHRLLSGPADLATITAHLDAWFERFDAGPLSGAVTVLTRMDDAGALALVTPDGFTLLRPRAERFPGVPDLDTSRLDAALEGVPVEVRYQHGVANVVAAVERGDAVAGVLVRPPRFEQIAATARGGERMPPKSTFFAPKPRTGLVYRLLTN